MTMVFLPASFVAASICADVDKRRYVNRDLLQSLFGMNIRLFEDGTHGTMAQYLAVTVPLTAITIWIMVGLRWQDSQDNEKPLVYQLGWPIRYSQQLTKRMTKRFIKRNKKMNEGVV
jgi:hypothetical protein